MSEEQVNQRAQLILKSLIERYIRDGLPIGSKTIAEDKSLTLSSASIRSVLSELEEGGYVFAPHTSAGRVPTNLGYRFFIDSLLTVRPMQAQQVDEVKQQLSGEKNLQHLVTSASHLLSGVTHQVGLVTVPGLERLTLRQIEFLPLSDKRVLVILVMNDNDVQNRIIHLDKIYSPSELEQAANLLNEQFAGKDLPLIREEILARMSDTKLAMDELMQASIDLASKAVAQQESQDDVVVAGQSNLLGLANTGDMNKLRQLFDAFTQKQEIMHLLDHCLNADGVQIFIGDESGHDFLQACSLVAKPYAVGDKVVGVLGVLGPTRMDYEKAISMVNVTAKLLTASLSDD